MQAAQKQSKKSQFFKIPKPWSKFLKTAIALESTRELEAFLSAELTKKKLIYPPQSAWFESLKYCSPENTRVVILGQDPYHGTEQAHGLSFSVKKGQKIPPSLRNIFKEIHLGQGTEIGKDGDLTAWAKQGVMLLNNVLTVEHASPASHQKKGWEPITNQIIETLDKDPSPKVFLLWGAHARKKASLIHNKNHLILEAPHPSPLSAHRGFLGCGHFSKANIFLKKNNLNPINWTL